MVTVLPVVLLLIDAGCFYKDGLVVLPVVLLVGKVPQAHIVIPVGWLYNIGPGVKLDAQLAKIVAQQVAYCSAHGRIMVVITRIKEHGAAFLHPAVFILIVLIKQGSGQARQQQRRQLRAVWFCRMKRQPQFLQARVNPHGQIFHARVFKQRDQRDLNRF